MRRLRWLSAVCGVLALAGCFESAPTLSNDDARLLEAAAYLFSGLEDNLDETGGKGMAWQRSVKGRAIEYWRISKNGIGFSDDDLNTKTRDSKYVRYTYRISRPRLCSFMFEETTEFSNRESRDDFSTFSMKNSANGMIFNVGDAHTFQFEDDGLSPYLRIAGPRVVCYDSGGCENAWNDVFSGLSQSRFGRSIHTERRKRALTVIKNFCPGKEF